MAVRRGQKGGRGGGGQRVRRAGRLDKTLREAIWNCMHGYSMSDLLIITCKGFSLRGETVSGWKMCGMRAETGVQKKLPQG